MRGKVLVAENEPRRAREFQASLESAGFQVIHASDCAGAWDLIQTEGLDLALVDTNLYGLREGNLLVRVRADPALSHLPIVILGGSASSDEVVKWLNLGADDYVSRSISSGLLAAEVHAKLRRGRRSSQPPAPCQDQPCPSTPLAPATNRQ